jgi:hypothetical protein
VTSRWIAVALTALGVVAGTIADRPAQHEAVVLGGYRVLAGDFHAHSSMWSNGMLTPWGLVLQARRAGLDVLAVTGHNEVWDAKVARAFARRFGGPTVVVGQEIHTAARHVVAAGIDRVVDFRLPLEQQLDDIHRQGGVAIAAHPVKKFNPRFSDAAVERLDGTELCRPVIYFDRKTAGELEAFAARGSMTPIGSSDFHGWARLGDCRTYLFASDDSESAVIEAIRAHRTVVYSPQGKVYGDPQLVALAATRPDLRRRATELPPARAVEWISRVLGIAGFAWWSLPRRTRAV